MTLQKALSEEKDDEIVAFARFAKLLSKLHEELNKITRKSISEHSQRGGITMQYKDFGCGRLDILQTNH